MATCFITAFSTSPETPTAKTFLHLVKPTTSKEDLLKTVMKRALTYFLDL